MANSRNAPARTPSSPAKWPSSAKHCGWNTISTEGSMTAANACTRGATLSSIDLPGATTPIRFAIPFQTPRDRLLRAKSSSVSRTKRFSTALETNGWEALDLLCPAPADSALAWKRANPSSSSASAVPA
ncbi:hypothetical protein SPHINGOAX6_10016 [Sphingomonas sp. AX6]|nr:hypothetical protein SPHINGOAX6_10016 [Sphingomonas sp. AX6]